MLDVDKDLHEGWSRCRSREGRDQKMPIMPIMVPYTVNGGLVKKFPRLTYKNDNKNAIADVRKGILVKNGNQVDRIKDLNDPSAPSSVT